MKLHALVKYYPDKSLISIVSGKPTKGNVNDSTVLPELMTDGITHGCLFADRGYDAESNYREVFRHGLLPFIKGKVNSIHGHYRNKAKRIWNEGMYKKTRGLVEGVFGGLETRYRNRTCSRLEHTRCLDILLLALSHNLRTYIKALIISDGKRLRAYVWIYSTTPAARYLYI